MSGTKRRSESTAIAIFPFLAVLLCTVGALVLILVVTVSNSRSSAKRNTEGAMEELKDASNLMQVVSEELEAQRESLKAKVEHRRRDLTDIEDHIARLTKTFEQLTTKIDLIQSEASQSDTSRTEKSTEISALRKEIDQKKRDLIEEIEKQKNRKPAFAVIPYVGPNGTSRRPVYLECTEKGVIIQPEGLMISLNDLKPPFGPGNPLDAALRVLRHAYQQTDSTFGITQPPYPLLIVRPDGIQTYALAREAMSGWDDQFGYELVDSEMDLTFPSSPAGLKEQLTSTVEMAKRRQQALMASMPRRMVPQDSDDGWDVIDDSNASHPTNEEGSSTSGGNSTTERKAGSGFSNGNEKQQNWQIVQGMANSQVTGAIQKNGMESTQFTDPSVNSAFTTDQSQRIPNSLAVGGADLSGQYRIAQGASVSPWTVQSLPNSPQSTGVPSQEGNDAQFGSNVGQSTAQAMMNPTGTNIDGSSSSSGNGTESANSGGSGTGTPIASNGSNGSNSQPVPGANAFSSGSATGGGTSGMQSAGGPAQPTSPDGSTAPNLSVNLDKTIPSQTKAKHVRPEGDLKPISVSAGHGWAASRAEGKATPVSRPINMVALKDRWLLRSDIDQNAFDLSVTMEAGPQQAGNQLAVALRKRVDSWGLSLPGGYWSPTLTIEAANDAQQSVARLEKLLEGSGVEIKVVTLKLPNRR